MFLFYNIQIQSNWIPDKKICYQMQKVENL